MLLLLSVGVSTIYFSTRFGVQEDSVQVNTHIPFYQQENSVWIDSLLVNMSLEQKAAQLLMKHLESDDTLSVVQTEHAVFRGTIGGVLFSGFPAIQQFETTKTFQKRAQLPLLVGMEQKGQMEDMIDLPDVWSLSAISDEQKLSELGDRIGYHTHQLGAQVYFTHHKEVPISAYNSLEKIQSGLNNRNILTCVQFQRENELAPTILEVADSVPTVYNKLTSEGVQAMVLGTEDMSDLVDSSVVTHNKGFTQAYFQQQIGFKGILFGRVDQDKDLTVQITNMMQGGLDVIILENREEEAMRIICQLVRGNLLSESFLEQKVRKVLQAKRWAGAKDFYLQSKKEEVQAPSLELATRFHRELTRSSITVLKDDSLTLPFHHIEDKRFLVLTIGENLPSFTETLSYYAPIKVDELLIDKQRGLDKVNSDIWEAYNSLIVVIGNTKLDSVPHTRFLEKLKKAGLEKEITIINFEQPQNLRLLENFQTLVQAYNHLPVTQEIMAQILFGGEAAEGKLPLQISNKLALGQGIQTQVNRLAYTSPEVLGIDSYDLSPLAAIAEEAIREQAMPGCQVLVAKAGNIIYNEAFGYHTYDSLRHVNTTDLYDIASITKIAATTLSGMKLYEQRKLNLHARLGNYFKDNHLRVDTNGISEIRYAMDTIPLKDFEAAKYVSINASDDQIAKLDTIRYQDSLLIIFRPSNELVLSQEFNIFNVRLEELFTHHSGIPIEMPLYPYIHNRQYPKRKYRDFYDSTRHQTHTVEVAEKLFMKDALKDSIWKRFKYSKVHKDKDYNYSDLNMILLQMAIDSITHQSLDQHLNDNFYKPLGLANLQYNPASRVEGERLIPTEYDAHWRKQLLKGHVHDPAAALMGGVAGNAGLFSNANDLAILFQMLLNGGEYGGRRYLNPETVSYFTGRKEGHRGLGFDKPPVKGRYIIAQDASKASYGHTGFTGTCVWVDPENELIFIFLSNRIYPDADNWKINHMRVRSRMHQAVYEALEKGNPIDWKKQEELLNAQESPKKLNISQQEIDMAG